MVRVITYPLVFAGGWIFNFVVDIKFFTGFAMGWLAGTKLGPVIDSILDMLQ